MTDHPRMTDNRGRTPRGLLTSAAPPRDLSEVLAAKGISRDQFADMHRIPDGQGYRRSDFTSGPCYLPPDETPPASRWRWWRDPAVTGALSLQQAAHQLKRRP